MNDNFYRAFEDRYRGTRELIASRLRVYLTFVEPLLAVYPQGQMVDLGSGRGEWLELMLQVGFKPLGVDLDEGMLQACYQLGLPAQQGEAISFLQALPDESQVVVSAFHVVEHIHFEQMQTLVSQAMRVLKPGGLLILETPNPENIVVASCNFHLDPSHLKPIPPDLLGFLVQHAGFAKVKTLRLQESPQLAQQANVSLQDVLTGPSPDYAIVAQKAGATELLELTHVGFNTDYGISLENLTNRWDGRIDRLETQVQQSMELALQAQSESQKFQGMALQAQSESQKFQELVLLAQSESQKSQELANSTANQLQALQASRSWRLTAPLRKIMALLRTLKRP